MEHRMSNLFEKLQANYGAERELNERKYNAENSTFYQLFGRYNEQKEELKHILAVKKRVLSMRVRLLQNIQLLAEKEMNLISQSQRELNLEKVA